ncbi:SCO3374 family protein [Streptomyces sp. NPDC052687]|uniref:SCO3374 family protein n=1 Tax=Streptomyces sp. NPDC052687 TaxID=3154759 RepID=UPI003418BA27
MVGAAPQSMPPSGSPDPSGPSGPSGTSPTVPFPRRPLDASAPVRDGREWRDLRDWYENGLGWPTVPGAGAHPSAPVWLVVGARFDVLDVPAAAGVHALRHLAPCSPVAVEGDRMRLLVAPGSAEELPGLLDWLEWGSLDLDLAALGEGAVMAAPEPVRGAGARCPARGAADEPPVTSPWAEGEPPVPAGAGAGREPGPYGGRGQGSSHPGPRVQGAAVWVRPPWPGCEAGASLPTLSALGGGGDAPDLVRVVDTVATHCHRIRLRRGSAQPLAFS